MLKGPRHACYAQESRGGEERVQSSGLQASEGLIHLGPKSWAQVWAKPCLGIVESQDPEILKPRCKPCKGIEIDPAEPEALSPLQKV